MNELASSVSILGFFTISLDGLVMELLQSFLLSDFETWSVGPLLAFGAATDLAAKEGWWDLEDVEGSVVGKIL